MDNKVEFDILHWRKLNGPKSPILTQMAQDILVIPTSFVAFENSFSKCRTIIIDTRSSLNDDSVKVPMCQGLAPGHQGLYVLHFILSNYLILYLWCINLKWFLPFKFVVGEPAKATEDGASMMCDLSSNEWDNEGDVDF